MAVSNVNRPPTWFWVIAIIALVWNLLGVWAYLKQVTMGPEALAELPEAQRQLYETVPAWATGAFAFAVFGGALGCVALLIGKAWAELLLLISLGGVLVQNFHSFFIGKSFQLFGPGGTIMPLMVIAVAIYLVWLSRRARSVGWII